MDHETHILSRMHSVVHLYEAVLRRFGVDTRNVLPGTYQSGHARNIDENNLIDIFAVHWQRALGATDVHYLYVDGPFYGGKLSIGAIEAFAWPDPDNPGLVKGVKERVAEIRRLGDCAVWLYLPGGVIYRGYTMRGFEAYLKDIYKNRDALCRLMDKLADFWVGVAQNAIDAAGPEAIDIVYFGEDLGTQEGCMFDPDGIYAKYIKPHQRRMVETVKSRTNAKVCFYCCGSAYRFIDHLIDIGGDALNPVQVSAKNVEPERLKEEFGERISFWGGINTQRILPFAMPEDVADETRRIIAILGKGGGYVLNAVHNIQSEVPPENIVAMFDASLNHAYDKAA